MPQWVPKSYTIGLIMYYTYICICNTSAYFLLWTFVSSINFVLECGRTLQENSGTFSSPSYNSDATATEAERCEWRITATHGERIVLNITGTNTFDSSELSSESFA